MTVRLAFEPDDWSAVEDHLLNSPVEESAIAFADVLGGPLGMTLVARSFYLCTPADYAYQSADHIELTAETHARIIREAWERRAAVIELHSHVQFAGNVRFSPSDFVGFQDWVPHVRWRLRGKPYAAVVVATCGLDALVWRNGSETPEFVDVIEIGHRALRPTRASHPRLHELHKQEGRRDA